MFILTTFSFLPHPLSPSPEREGVKNKNISHINPSPEGEGKPRPPAGGSRGRVR
jgi:hypothetical protein